MYLSLFFLSQCTTDLSDGYQHFFQLHKEMKSSVNSVSPSPACSLPHFPLERLLSWSGTWLSLSPFLSEAPFCFGFPVPWVTVSNSFQYFAGRRLQEASRERYTECRFLFFFFFLVSASVKIQILFTSFSQLIIWLDVDVWSSHS